MLIFSLFAKIAAFFDVIVIFIIIANDKGLVLLRLPAS